MRRLPMFNYNEKQNIVTVHKYWVNTSHHRRLHRVRFLERELGLAGSSLTWTSDKIVVIKSQRARGLANRADTIDVDL